MPFIVRGKTKCKICNKIIYDDDKIVTFPPMVAAGDKFAFFSNAVMHRTCFFSHPMKEELLNKLQQIYDPNDIYGSKMLEYVHELISSDD